MTESGTLESLIERLRDAHAALGVLIGDAHTPSEVTRLSGKQDGVALALSYTYEELRLTSQAAQK